MEVTIRGYRVLQGIEIAKKIVDAALERQASEILLLDVSEICSFADYFVVCSGETERQLKAIAQEIDSTLSKEQIHVPKPQGSTESGWLVLDLGDIIVHIFSPQKREFYALEDMWENSSTILKIP